MRANSLAFRLVVGAGLWIVAALLAGGLLLSAVFSDYVERAFDARLQVLLDAIVAAASVDKNGDIQLSRGPSEPRFQQPYSGWYWQVADKKGPLLRSRSLWDQVLSPDYRLIGRGGYGFQMAGVQKQSLRIVGRDVTLPGSDKTYRFVVSGDTSEVRRDVAAFNWTLARALGVLGVGLIIAVLIQVRYGLLPLRRIRDALADVSSGRRDRMQGNFPSEVEPLVDEINILLDNNAAVVDRARTHVGNLAHALKTPLSVLTNAVAQPAADTGALMATVRQQVAAMRRHVDHYLARARTAAASVLGARTALAPVVADLSRTLARIHTERAIDIQVAGVDGLYFRGERQDLEEMLGNLIDNACKWASSRVRVVAAAAADGGRLTVSVEDDGPGLSDDEKGAAFGRGHRLDEAVPGSGLGLAIVHDIARLYDGAVTLEDSEMGGLRAVLDLPAALPGAPSEGRPGGKPGGRTAKGNSKGKKPQKTAQKTAGKKVEKEAGPIPS